MIQLTFVCRVPSPWTAAARHTNSSRSSQSSTATPPDKNPPACADRQVEVRNGSTVDDREPSADGFFALDVDLDLESMTVADGADTKDSDSTVCLQTHLAPEPDTIGNLEYKLRILPPTRHRYDRLLTQLKWRLLQGGGQCTYEIGVLDDGKCIGICLLEMQASLRVLSSMATDLGANVHIRKVLSKSTDDMNVLPLRVARTLLSRDKSEVVCACGMSSSKLTELTCYMAKAGLESCPDLSSSETSLEDSGALHYDVEDDESFAWHDDQQNDSIDSSPQSKTHENVDDYEQGLFPYDDEDHDVAATFSLSLDEQATRLGLDQQKREHRKPCKYSHKDAVLQQNRWLDNGEEKSSLEVGHAHVSSPAEQSYPLSDRCQRIIVEAAVSRNMGHEAFIDYTSL